MSSDAAVTVRFTLTRAEALAGQRRIQWRLRRHWVYVAAVLAFGVVGVLVGSWGVASFGFSAAAFYAGYVFWLGPRLVWRRVAQIRGPQVITVTDDGISTEHLDTASTTAWRYWAHIGTVGDAYAVQGSQRRYLLIPHRAFESTADELRFQALVERHTGCALM
jgi:hypothetical protein